MKNDGPYYVAKQGVALTGRNRTGPPCSLDYWTAHAPSCRRADRPRAALPTTDDSVQNNTGPLGGPVKIMRITFCTV